MQMFFWVFYLLFFPVMVKPELIFVHALWRHGDRSPVQQGFPLEKSSAEDQWPQGYGELTQEGMRQHYNLGRYLSNRYAGFISRNYSQYEVYITTSGFNRTVMSAAANMAGFYSTEPGRFLKSLAWSPVPIHSLPDSKIFGQAPCPTITKFNADPTKELSEEIQKLRETKKTLIQWLATKSSLAEKDIKAGTFFDALTCEKSHMRSNPWPDWVTEKTYAEIVQWFHEEMKLRDDFTPVEIKKLSGGALLKDMVARMHDAQSDFLFNRPKRLKYYAYSGHDSTVIPFLAVLGAFNAMQPPYASVVLLELHNQGDRFIVKAFYKNDSSDPRPLHVKNCGASCSLDQFTRRSEQFMPSDFSAECGLTSFFDLYLKVITISLAVVCAMLLALVLFLLWKLREFRNRSIRYKPVKTQEDSLLVMEEFSVNM